jgi:hypothetical protein
VMRSTIQVCDAQKLGIKIGGASRQEDGLCGILGLSLWEQNIDGRMPDHILLSWDIGIDFSFFLFLFFLFISFPAFPVPHFAESVDQLWGVFPSMLCSCFFLLSFIQISTNIF